MSLAPELLAVATELIAEFGQSATIRWPAPGTDPENPPVGPVTPVAAAVVPVVLGNVKHALVDGITVLSTDSEIVVSSTGLSAPIVPGVTFDFGGGHVLTAVHSSNAGVNGQVIVYEAIARSMAI